jgi:hypothetical protein
VQTRDALLNTGSWSTSQSATTDACPTEELDQQQTQSNYKCIIYSARWGGQSFTPTMSILTQVELYVKKVGTPPSTLTLSVRSSNTGADLVSVSKAASQIPTSSNWVEFDFSDLTITPGSTYYLVLKTSGGNSKNCYYWGYGFFTPYTNGVRLDSFIGGSIWRQCLLYDFCFKTYGLNDYLNTPTINGSTEGKAGREYTYTTSTTDPDGNQLYYLWDWGDGTTSGWLGPYNSGATCQANHTWNTKGNYNIKVKAKDIYGKESVWSDPLPVTMPYSYNKTILQFLELLFQRFPNAFPLLRQLMGC